MLALYRKYRPAKFSELIGQEVVRDTLRSEVANKMTAHAYLFIGPRGTGKTSTARILAAAVNCEQPQGGEPCGACSRCSAIRNGRYLDLIEIDAASQTGVDNVRENIIESARFIPQAGPYKIYILDEAHMLSISAWNALLKTLEEPPPGVIFIFATTESRKIPDTILSRCQQFRFRPVDHEALKKRLRRISQAEGVSVDEEVFDEITLRAGGYIRDAESLLGQLFSLGGTSVTWKEAQGILEHSSLEDILSFLKTVMHGDAENAFRQLNELQEEGVDVSRFTIDLLEALRAMHYRAITRTDHPLYIRRHGKAGIALIEELLGLPQDPMVLRKALGIIIDQLDKSREVPSDLTLEIITGELAHHFAHVSGRRDYIRDDHGHTRPPPPQASEGVQKDGSKEKDNPTSAKKTKSAPLAETSVDEKEELKLASKKHHPAGITLHKVKELWQTVIEKVHKKNHALPFVLKFVEPLEVEENQIRVGCKYQFHHDRLSALENRRIVEQALSEALGVPTIIKIEYVAEAAAPPSQEDAALDTLVNLFGGRVVEG
ncbi:MAG: DNA polymerase III subunit gamma/tau [Patescibacteria group bacterium]